MSKSADKTLIGAFVAGALALLVAAVAVFGSGKLFKSSATTFVMFFDKSISGLNIGSPVVFRGVPVGRVTDIRLIGDVKDMAFRIPVYVEVGNKTQMPLGLESMDEGAVKEYMDKLVAHGLRARLSAQSLLTGQLAVEMDFFPAYEAGPPINSVSEYQGVLEIPTIPSRMDSIWHKISTMPVDEVAANVLRISQQINELLDNQEIGRLAAHTDELLRQITKVAADIDKTFVSFNSTGGKYGRLADKLSIRLDKALMQLDKTLASFGSTATEAQQALSSARSVVGQNSVTVLEFNRALREAAEAARAVRGLADTLQRNPEALLFGKGEPRR